MIGGSRVNYPMVIFLFLRVQDHWKFTFMSYKRYSYWSWLGRGCLSDQFWMIPTCSLLKKSGAIKCLLLFFFPELANRPWLSLRFPIHWFAIYLPTTVLRMPKFMAMITPRPIILLLLVCISGLIWNMSSSKSKTIIGCWGGGFFPTLLSSLLTSKHVSQMEGRGFVPKIVH